MKIHDGGNTLLPHILSNKVQTPVGDKANSKTREISGQLTSIDTQAVKDLAALLNSGANVRESIVEEIKLKIETGEYLKQSAAVATADAILNL